MFAAGEIGYLLLVPSGAAEQLLCQCRKKTGQRERERESVCVCVCVMVAVVVVMPGRIVDACTSCVTAAAAGDVGF